MLDGIDLASSSGTVRALTEATLAFVLFATASRIHVGALRRTVGVPVRLLGIGLPLTIALGAVAAALVFGELTVEEAVILAVVLAPTDAALRQAVASAPWWRLVERADWVHPEGRSPMGRYRAPPRARAGAVRRGGYFKRTRRLPCDRVAWPRS